VAHPNSGIPAEQRFEMKVDRTGDCHLWTGGCSGDGYGFIKVGARIVSAHRYAFELHHGRSPVGLVLHDCGNRRCVRPEHLYEGDARQNAADRDRHGTTAFGERNGNHRLTEAEVREMKERRRAGATQVELADRFGVGQPMVSMILSGRYWKSID